MSKDIDRGPGRPDSPAGGPARESWTSRAARWAILAALVAAVFPLIAIPLPARVVDALAAASLGFAVVVALLLRLDRPPFQFPVLPTVLVCAGAYRIGVGTAITRLALTDGFATGPRAAGEVVSILGGFATWAGAAVGLGAMAIVFVAARSLVFRRVGSIESTVPHDGPVLDRETDIRMAYAGAGAFLRGEVVAVAVMASCLFFGTLALGCFQHGLDPRTVIGTLAPIVTGAGLVMVIPPILIAPAMARVAT